mmetsp:Transcript_102108/g.289105  ORF Transcript_102108/g.289105 Transcript_102108/m.289105 type:complete len:273 (-) Transcript_102108:1271-2089(-)
MANFSFFTSFSLAALLSMASAFSFDWVAFRSSLNLSSSSSGRPTFSPFARAACSASASPASSAAASLSRAFCRGSSTARVSLAASSLDESTWHFSASSMAFLILATSLAATALDNFAAALMRASRSSMRLSAACISFAESSTPADFASAIAASSSLFGAAPSSSACSLPSAAAFGSCSPPASSSSSATTVTSRASSCASMASAMPVGTVASPSSSAESSLAPLDVAPRGVVVVVVVVACSILRIALSKAFLPCLPPAFARSFCRTSFPDLWA